MIYILCFALVGLGAFLLGIIVGIKDCKKQFGIPKNCTGEDIVIAVKPCEVTFDDVTTRIHYSEKGCADGSINS